MNVWLIHPGELLPIDGQVRLYRYGILAEWLARRGHHVTRWAPTFVHATKTYRCHADKTEWINPNYRIELLHAPGYQHHIGLRRFLFHKRIARRFREQAELQVEPDVILCAMPDPDLCVAATEYGRRKQIPVVIDVRDLWPDAALDRLPPWSRRSAEWLLGPILAKNRRAFSAASGIIGISPGFCEWGLRHAGRGVGPTDGVFYMAAPTAQFSEEAKATARRKWAELNVVPDLRFRCCFLAMIGALYDLDTPIQAARRLLEARDHDSQFVICGDGPKLHHLREAARGLTNVVIPGWVQPVDVQVLLEMSQVGMIPYRRGASTSLPNKAVTYFSGGLPVISTAGGEFASILQQHQCGVTYEAENVDDFLNVFNRLRRDTPLRISQAENSRTFFHEELEADRVFSSLVAYLENIAGPSQKKCA